MGRRRRGGPLLSIKGETRIEEPSAAERAIGRRAAESRATVPSVELSVPVPQGAALSTAHLVRACAQALGEHPRANGAYRGGQFELHSRIHVGVVVATEEVHAIPTVFDADKKSISELDQELALLTADATAGALAAPAFGAATFTLWNAAEHGIAAASIPVVAPQAAALVAGTQALTLCCDHRILYGARAAAFLKAIAHHLDGDGI